MRLATLRDGSKDGRLVLVSPDGLRYAFAPVSTLQAALEQWDAVAPELLALVGVIDGQGQRVIERTAGKRGPRLCAQALEQLQIGFAVLRAERADGVIAVQFEAALSADNSVFPEHLFDDLWHRTATEDALADAQVETTQFRPQTDPAQS